MYESGEIYEIMEQFEQDIKRAPVYTGRFEKEPRGTDRRWKNNAYYCDGQTNGMFLAYLWGHAAGRCYERTTAAN